MGIMEIITGGSTIITGIFLLALTFFGWNDIALFLEPNEERSMRIMLFFVAIMGVVFLISGIDTFINLTG